MQLDACDAQRESTHILHANEPGTRQGALPESASTPRLCGASTRWGVRKTESALATSPSRAR